MYVIGIKCSITPACFICYVHTFMCSAFADHPMDKDDLKCNTEKDTIKLHERSAGTTIILCMHSIIHLIN